MIETIKKLLDGKGENYILPFFWQHGEDEETLRKYMQVIYDCGIRAVCVEARPHPDFAGPKWWTDLDIIMDEARNRDMKVWVLDDSHFPTGYANGALENADPSLCKQYLNVNTSDVCGPLPQAELNVDSMAKTVLSPFGPSGGMQGRSTTKPRVFDDDSLLCVIAAKLINGDTVDSTFLDLTDKVVDGKLVWDIPDGMWRIFVFYNTRNGGGRPHYINMIDKDSVRVLIDTVYEPHYEHYKDDFGKTFAGFFSDEPSFGNTLGYDFNESIGRRRMPIPWNKDVPLMLEERLGTDWKQLLPMLYADSTDSDLTALTRYSYMDTVTNLVKENFSNQISKWCEEHGVEYIGHLIEDNNQHSRLGASLGHYFRALDGQHMAGIDNIGNQVLIGGENHIRSSGIGVAGDGEFFHFALGKLASSHAHIDPKKKGRAMCENYGAYGWGTGVRQIKWITDHFLVRGINYYVPHAFSPKDYPDPDCPPHFYAHGHNPQYRHFQKLMFYLNRMCNIFNDGTHIAQAALLYHGEAEWTGGYMFLQKPARELMENQIDFDILPSDVFSEMDKFNTSFDDQLHVNGETYKTLIVPYAEYITRDVARFVAKAVETGFEVIFVDEHPSGICNSDDAEESLQLIRDISKCKAVPLSKLAKYVEEAGYKEVSLSSPFKRMRYYHYRKGGQDTYMFSNEDPSKTYEGSITVSAEGPVFVYDAMENLVHPINSEPCDRGTKLYLNLEPYQSIVVIFGTPPSELVPLPQVSEKKVVLSGEWKLSFAKSLDYPNFSDEMTISKLESVGKIKPEFSGFMRYETTCVLDEEASILEIEDAYDGVEVWINDKYAGMKVCPPYRFNITGLAVTSENQIRIEVANTLDREFRAMEPNSPMLRLRGVTPLAPSGIVGDVTIKI